jgi:hypothetical protein
MNLRDLPLGALIVRDGLARPDAVRVALIDAQESDRRLGEVMLERGLIRERDLARLLAKQEKLEFVDLAKVELVGDALDCLSEHVADPTDDAALDAVRAALPGRRVRFHVALTSEIAAALDEGYGEPVAAA